MTHGLCSDCQYLPETCSGAAIGIDVLAGFPGETEEHFANTELFLKNLDYTYLHVFPYSKRPGTLAASFQTRSPSRSRTDAWRTCGLWEDKKRPHSIDRYLGTVRNVLVEGKRTAKGMLKGFTDNYISVILPGDDSLINTLVPVQLLEISGEDVKGKRVQESDES